MSALSSFDLTAAAARRTPAAELAAQLPAPTWTHTEVSTRAPARASIGLVAGTLHLLITLSSLAILAYTIQLQAMGIAIAAAWLVMAHWCEQHLATSAGIFLGRNFWRWGMLICLVATVGSSLPLVAKLSV